MPYGDDVSSGAASRAPRVAPPFDVGPAVLAATRATLSTLFDEGRLPEDQARLVLWLLDEAANAKGEEIRNASSEGGWTDLPELAAEAIFGPGDVVVTGGENIHRELLGSARRVCRSWRRSVSRHCKQAMVRLELYHAVPHWTAQIERVVPSATCLVLDLGQGPDCHNDQGSGAGAIAAASAHLRSLELRNWWLSSADLAAIAEHLTALTELRLSSRKPCHFHCLGAIGSIAKISTLEVLELDCKVPQHSAHLPGVAWRPLGSLTRLRELVIQEANKLDLESDLPSITPTLPQLTKLSLPLEMKPQILRALRPLTNLRNLELQPPSFLMEVVPDLAELESLRSCTIASSANPGPEDFPLFLSPDGIELGNEAFAAVKAPQLQQLVLRHVLIVETGCLKGLASLFPGLVEVTFDSADLFAADLPELGCLKHLSKLDVLACSLNGAIAEPGLKCLSALKQMELGNVTRDPLFAQGLLQLLLPTALERVTLSIAYELFTFDEIVTALSPLRHLRHLTLRGALVIKGSPGVLPNDNDEIIVSSDVANGIAHALPHLATITIA